MKKIDFLAIGDIVIDAFIKLKDAHVHKGIDDSESSELCIRFGDKVPYESVDIITAVGNSPNAAVSASRLGLSSAVMTNIGNDKNGQDCLDKLREEKIDTTFVKTEEGKKTNYHYVLWYGVERTILIKHENFNYEWTNTKKSQDYHSPSWIYLSSLGENSLQFHTEIADYLKRHINVKLAFQPGTFQISLGTEKLKDIYARTEIFFCNVEEAEKILGIKNKDIKILSTGIHKLGPKIVSISDGPNGAYASDGENIYFTPMYPDIAAPVDRTGAGDAFSSTFTSALALGKTIPEALSWGPINSMSVVQKIGAQEGLLSKEKLEKYLKTAPKDYKLTKI
ncbi:MAG: carbohydrate kinase family protein [Candidatus Paceibacterota bacterium]|jgi:ribokinase